MSGTVPPPVVPRKPSGIRVMIPTGDPLPSGGLADYGDLRKNSNTSTGSKHTPQKSAEREVEFLNHCFDDIERFMARLQQTAEAQVIVGQRKKKKRSKKKDSPDDDLLNLKACPPSEEEFVDVFQKIKYSLSLLGRLQSAIADPDAPELLHHIFVPLGLMVKTTAGPDLGSTVLSPALTRDAVSLLQEHLTQDEKELWTSLGAFWTSPCSQLNMSVPPYAPVFMDGWRPATLDVHGQPLEDPVQCQHKEDAVRERMEEQVRGTQERTQADRTSSTDEVEGTWLPPDGERFYCCSYDFVARNSSELSVLQGETLEVIESSKRWWKCRNRFDQVGFVPFNILEPLSALNNAGTDSAVVRRESKKVPLSPPTNKYFSYSPPSSNGTGSLYSHTSPTLQPHVAVLPPSATQGEDGDKVLMVNEELAQRLANGRPGSVRPLVIPRSTDTSVPLNYTSPPAEVEAWLTAKGFGQQTVESLGILTGAQLFSLNKDELRAVSPDEGVRVYSQIMVQKSLLEDVRKATELETVMQKQKRKIDLDSRHLAV